MGLSAAEVRIIDDTRRNGPMTMALDEAAAETVSEGGPATVRVYTWPDTLTLGYRQTADCVDWEYCAREDIAVTRRQTGGGGIYHDHAGDLSYSVIVPTDAAPGDLRECYELFCAPVLDAIDRLGIDSHFAKRARKEIYLPACYLRSIDPAHDIVGPDGRKIAGNAQYRQRDAIVQHGSISFSLRPKRHCGCFAGDPDPNDFRTRVGALNEYADVDRDIVASTLRESFATLGETHEGTWYEAELDRARELVDAKYDAEEWIRRR
jgi:lipoate-protein ligase A